MNLVDSSGWIEFFKAGANGPLFKPVIEDRRHLLVPTIALFEVHKVLSRALPEVLVTQCLDVMRLLRYMNGVVTSQCLTKTERDAYCGSY
jgi:hypothetical protein